MLLCLAGGGLAVLASGRPWARAVLRQPPLATVGATVSGHSLTPAVAALGLVGLAGVVAVLATRGTGRLATGVLLALAGAGVVAVSLQVRLDLDGRTGTVLERAAGAPGAAARHIRPTSWPVVSAAAGLLLGAGGVLTATRGRGWSTLSARHDVPGGDVPPEPVEPAHMWDAQDRGEDPTRPTP